MQASFSTMAGLWGIALALTGCGSGQASSEADEPLFDASAEAFETGAADASNLAEASGLDASEQPVDSAIEGGWDAEGGAQDAGSEAEAAVGVALRYLAINVGNASPQYGCWEYKLCRSQDVEHLRAYIDAWKPDVVMLSEVLRQGQLKGTESNGPILPSGYDGRCGQSKDRNSGEPAAWDAPNASHEHECVAWRTDRVALVEGSAQSAYGRNDPGHESCAYDFTGFRVKLLLEGQYELTAVAVHPNSTHTDCRVEEIGRYWSELAEGARVLIGGDWNTELDEELQVGAGFQVNYSRGRHWTLAEHPEEYSAEYMLGLEKRKLDHTFSSFGDPDTSVLPFGSALGGYDGHPRADQGEGFDHRQQLVDILLTP